MRVDKRKKFIGWHLLALIKIYDMNKNDINRKYISQVNYFQAGQRGRCMNCLFAFYVMYNTIHASIIRYLVNFFLCNCTHLLGHKTVIEIGRKKSETSARLVPIVL